MTTKLKVALTAAVVLIGALAWLVWGNGAPGPRLADDVAARTPLPAQGNVLAPTSSEAAAAAAAGGREAVVTPPPPAVTGSVVATVRYATEPVIAAGVPVVFSRPGDDLRVSGIRAVTDAAGVARFDGLAPGPGWLRVPGREIPVGKVNVEGGATQQCTLLERRGITLAGVVVDTSGAPIGGALVEVASPATDSDVTPVAITAADGTFTVRGCISICLVGARARGFAASHLHFRMRDEASTETVRIELLAAGGAVEGVVLGPDGEPVAGALVRVGEGQTESIRSTAQGASPLPAQVRTDTMGRFVAIGVPVGTQPIMARATDLAPWRGTCEVAPGAVTAARIALTAGVTCNGCVFDEGGQPTGGIHVSVGEPGAFERFHTRSDAAGRFTLRGLPSGNVEVVGEKWGVGRAIARVTGEPGGTVTCELRISGGLVLRGRVVDEAGAPVAGASIMGETVGEGRYWRETATADAEGRFRLVGCPAERTLAVTAAARERPPVTKGDLRPGGEELVLQLPRETAPRARLIGRLLRPDGTGAVGTTIQPYLPDPRQSLGEDFHTVVKAADGAFEIPVPAGRWTVRVIVKDHATIFLEGLVLTAGEVRDLGVLQVTRGGTLRVEGDGAAKLDYLVLTREERFVCGIFTAVQPLRTERLAPGEYVLQVKGAGIAAQALPFTIEAEREAVLTVATEPGVRQRVEFTPPAAVQRPRWVSYVLRRDGAFVTLASTDRTEQDLLVGDVWLAPGDYELTTRDREPATAVRFTVPAADPAPVRVALR